MAIPAEKMNVALPNNTVTLDVPTDTSEQVTGSLQALEMANVTVIDSQMMLEVASAELKQIKARGKLVEEFRKKITSPLDTLKKQYMDFFRPANENYLEAERILKNKLDNYINEQKRIQAEERRKAEEAARQERERLQKQAEEQRKIEEAAQRERQALEQKAQQESNAKKQAELKRQAEEAARKEEEAKVEQSLLNQQAEVTQAPAVVAPEPKASGISQRVTYSAEVTDKMELLKAIVDGQVPDCYVDVNMQLMKKQAVALKSHFDFPGMKLVKSTGIASR